MSEMRRLSPAWAGARCSVPASVAPPDFLVPSLALGTDSKGSGIANLPILLADFSHSWILTFLLYHENHNCMLRLGKWRGDYCKAWIS